MHQFAQLYRSLDESTKTNDKVASIVDYLKTAPDSDACWAVYFLAGQKLGRLVTTKLLRQWSMAKADIPEWLFEERTVLLEIWLKRLV